MATKKPTRPAAAKTKKTVTTSKGTGTKKAAPRKSAITEEDIRKKAEEIYYERVARGEHGSSEEDWVKAEQALLAAKK